MNAKIRLILFHTEENVRNHTVGIMKWSLPSTISIKGKNTESGKLYEDETCVDHLLKIKHESNSPSVPITVMWITFSIMSTLLQTKPFILTPHLVTDASMHGPKLSFWKFCNEPLLLNDEVKGRESKQDEFNVLFESASLLVKITRNMNASAEVWSLQPHLDRAPKQHVLAI